MNITQIEGSQPFYEGQEVICINDYFPLVRTTSEDKSRIGSKSEFHPKKHELLVIDEILGPFLRFNKYDSDEVGFQWWHHSSFVAKSALISNEEYKRITKALYPKDISKIFRP